MIRPGSKFSAYGSKIRTYITFIRPLTEALLSSPYHFEIKKSHRNEKRQKPVSGDLNCAIDIEVVMRDHMTSC